MALTSKLNAVNTMLSVIGETPVNSLTSGLVEAEQAETILAATSREVQSEGWNFNREINKTYPATSFGEIFIEPNVLRADASEGPDSLELVQRGARMYDRGNNTYQIGKSVKLDTVIELDFEELPEVARHFITIKAARVFQDRVIGSQELHGFNQRDEKEAYFQLKEFEGESEDYSIFDHASVAKPLYRMIGS